MLHAIPASWFSWGYNIFDGDARVASMSVSWVRERGEVTIGGRVFAVGRERALSGAFMICDESGAVATAIKPSALVRSFEVRCEGDAYTLRAASPLTRRFVLERDDLQVGSIGPRSLVSRRMTIDLPEELPLEVRVFMGWLVAILWKRQDNSSNS